MNETKLKDSRAILDLLRANDVAGFLAEYRADDEALVHDIRDHEPHPDFLNHVIRCHQQQDYANTLRLVLIAEAIYGKSLISLKLKYVAMLAVDLQLHYRDAIAIMEELLRADPNDRDTLWNLGQYGQWGGEDPNASLLRTITCYTRLITLGDQDSAELHRRIGQAYIELQDYEQARLHLTQARDLKPELANQVDALLNDIGTITQIHEKKSSKKFFSRYPEQAEFKKSHLEFIQNYTKKLFNGIKFINKKTRFLTIGSCFAENICIFLSKNGYISQTIPCSEHINSTFSNRVLIDWLLGTPHANEENYEKIEKYVTETGHSHSFLLEKLRHCDVFIYSLGVGAGFFRRDNGAFIMPGPSEINQRALAAKFLFRTTTVAENVDNLKHILQSIQKINPKMRIILTVSPVPLRVTFEHKSAFMADCISKSVLRAACDEVLRSMPDPLIYWPSFEYVRWLSGHTSPVFGIDDDSPMHVSGALIGSILRTFLSTFSEEAPVT